MSAPDAENFRDYGYCLGYVVGFVSGVAVRDAQGAQGKFCPPSGTRIRDFIAAIHDWLVANPNDLHKLGAAVASAAFLAKFPCATGEPPR